MTTFKKYFSGLSFNTLLLTFASLFADISTEMLYPVLPIFLTQILKAPTSVVGIVEGVATATQNIVQGFSGSLADKLQKRKSIALVGYTLAAFSKPLIGLGTVWQHVLGARFLDRFGTGVRSAPRDGLIAQSASEQNRGKAFGLEGIGDNLGAFIGPVVAAALLFYFAIPIRWIFYIAIVPGLLAVAMILFIRERHVVIPAKTKLDASLIEFSSNYWKYIGITALFGLANFSNAFLILRSRAIGIPLTVTILIYACFNLVAAISSFPAGTLSDKLGRKTILAVSFLILIVTYAGFAFSTNLFLIGFLFILYGIFSGTYRTVGKALASDFVPPYLRAGAVGWYSTTIGLSGLIASIVAGNLWTTMSASATFIYGVIFALLALLFLLPMRFSK